MGLEIFFPESVMGSPKKNALIFNNFLKLFLPLVTGGGGGGVHVNLLTPPPSHVNVRTDISRDD